MAPVTKPSATKIVKHFTHPKHSLQEFKEDKEYICDGCNTLGSGTRYRCKECKFDLHEYCATCPTSLSSHMDPKHPLILVSQALGMMKGHGCPCNVCGEQVQGLFYACPTCNFFIHPLCTTFPSHLQHVMDPKHLLTFQSAPPSWCSICRGVCASWRYRCEPCRIDIHLECVDVPYYAAYPPYVPPTAPFMPPPPPPSPYYCYAMPSPSMHGTYQHPIYNVPQGSGSTSGSTRKKIYALAGRLAVGVLFTALNSTVRYAIMIDGIAKRFIIPLRGEAAGQGLISSIRIKRRCASISHVLFAWRIVTTFRASD
ncbi:hypothetical protein HHK36_016292 [Tetracentron sinense]|uniref:DC1 domain-containing protein n=1 Tax=Tetracentron sinense TaxID=13715 RepID=A0A834YWX7_TETSI|nr:hypothetical protein HHK36_016292 [Tetracentron sinense]